MAGGRWGAPRTDFGTDELETELGWPKPLPKEKAMFCLLSVHRKVLLVMLANDQPQLASGVTK